MGSVRGVSCGRVYVEGGRARACMFVCVCVCEGGGIVRRHCHRHSVAQPCATRRRRPLLQGRGGEEGLVLCDNAADASSSSFPHPSQASSHPGTPFPSLARTTTAAVGETGDAASSTPSPSACTWPSLPSTHPPSVPSSHSQGREGVPVAESKENSERKNKSERKS